MAINSLPAFLEVRLYNEDATTHRVLPLAGGGLPGVASGVNARVTAREGYGEGALPLQGTRDDFPDLVLWRQVEFWARYQHPVTGDTVGDLMYRGKVARITPSKGVSGDGESIPTVKVALSGVWAEAGKKPCQKRYANSAGDDKAFLFADLARYARTGRLADVSVQALPVGDTLDYLDAYDVLFGKAADTLASGSGRIATGGDVEPISGLDRLFFRPFDDYDAAGHVARHVISLPDVQAGRNTNELDATKQITVLDLLGGAHRFGGNLLAAAVEGNTGFEWPEIAGTSGAGNLINHGGFEFLEGGEGFGGIGGGTGTTDGSAIGWILTGGASIKKSDAENVSPYEGEYYLELDSVGEKARHVEASPSYAIVAGHQYAFDLHARLANQGKIAVAVYRLQWQNGGGSVIRTDTINVAPVSTDFGALFSQTVIAPAGATGLAVEVELISQTIADGQYAVLIDAIRVYDIAGVTQKGWEARNYGAALFNILRWDDDSAPWQGGRCVYLDVSASDADGQDGHIQPFGFNRFSVRGGQAIRGGFAVRLAPGSPSIKVLVELWEWDKDGKESGKTKTAYTITSTSWTIITASRTMGENAAQSIVFLTLRGSGRLYVDGAFALDALTPLPDAAHPELFIEGENFRARYRAADLFAPGNAIHDSAVLLGDIIEQESREEITSAADGERYARAQFAVRVPDMERVNQESFGVISTGEDGQSTATMMPGESVRLIGKDGADLLSGPLPVTEKTIEWSDGKLTITPYLLTEPRDYTRTLTEIVRSIMRNEGPGQNSGSASYSGGLSGGSGGGGGGSAGITFKGKDGTMQTGVTAIEMPGATFTYDATTGTVTIVSIDAGGF